MAWTRRTELHHSLWANWGTQSACKKMHWSRELWLLTLSSSSSMYFPLRFHWLRNKGVQVSVCFFTKYRVNEDSRAGKRLRLILVLRETNVSSLDQLKVRQPLWLKGFYFGNDAFSTDLWGAVWFASKGREGLRKSEDGGSSLRQFDRSSRGEISKVHVCKKFSFFVEWKDVLCLQK